MLTVATPLPQARDSLQWYSGLYTAGVTGACVAGIAGKLPKAAAIPIVMGGFMLTNMADMAYGNKLMRVQKEAEVILAVRRRMVPVRNTPPSHCLYQSDLSTTPSSGNHACTH